MKNGKRKTKNVVISRPPFSVFRFSFFIFHLPLIVVLAGCSKNAGTGGTGEIVVPKQRLREVEPFDPDKFTTPRSATQPATKIAATNPTTHPAQIELSIERCRQLALEGNLGLKVQLLNPTIAKETLNEDEARFEALFLANSSYATTDAATSSTLNNAQANAFHADAGVQVPLRTGGNVTVSLPIDRFETNNAFSTLNPAYTTNLEGSLNVPLLRTAGLYYNTQQIRIAFYEYQATQAQTKLEVTRVLAELERVYWQLYAAREELIVRQKQRDLAVAQLERARRQVRAQVAAEVEITRAESGVSDTVEAIITAENAVRTAQRNLKGFLNAGDLGVDTDTIVIPTTPPNPIEYRLDGQKLVQSALRDRMEMLQTELRIAEEVSNIRNAKNDLLPLVTLQYQYTQNGLGKTLGRSFDLLERNRFADHFVGLHLEVPIGNEAARSRLRAALARRLQQLATREQQAVQIEQDVLNALDTLELSWQKIVAAHNRVVLNARLVDAETRQFELGLRTSTEVLDAQSKLADARSSEIGALTIYQIAQVDLAFATGNVLGATRVIWQPTPVPASSGASHADGARVAPAQSQQ
jgi:outer membrane protein